MKPNNASTEGTKRAALYREAARSLEDRVWYGPFSCNALENLGADEKELSAYRDMFSQNGDGGYLRASAFDPDGLDQSYDARAAARILALCFMAAMVEAGDA